MSYYRVERTYLTDTTGKSRQQNDAAHYVSSGCAISAVSAFVDQDRARLVGPVSELQGDKATATAVRDGQIYVVFAERGDEALPRRVAP
jgi:hypothetical protein